MFITSKNKYLSNDTKIFRTCSIPLMLNPVMINVQQNTFEWPCTLYTNAWITGSYYDMFGVNISQITHYNQHGLQQTYFYTFTAKPFSGWKEGEYKSSRVNKLYNNYTECLVGKKWNKLQQNLHTGMFSEHIPTRIYCILKFLS